MILGKKPTLAPSTPTVASGAPAPATPSSTPPAPVAAPTPSLSVPPQAQTNLPPLPAKIDRRKPVANILIVGESGSGKTRSLKDLNWASGSIAFIDTECKGFEWQHLIPDDCYFPCRNYSDVLQVMRHVEANPKFTIGVVDSFTGFNIGSHESCKTTYTGYDIYSQLNSAAVKLLNACKSPRVRWILTAIPETLTVESAGNTLGVVIKRAAVVGRELEGKVESYFSYAVFLKVVAATGKKSEHYYILQTDGKTQAKIPEGVTNEVQIDNSMAKLLSIIEKAEAGK
jgi:hypothetical protein